MQLEKGEWGGVEGHEKWGEGWTKPQGSTAEGSIGGQGPRSGREQQSPHFQGQSCRRLDLLI